MNTVLIWGIAKDYDENLGLLKYYESIHEIQIIGVTSNDTYIKILDGYHFYDKKEITNLTYDFLVICSENKFQEIKQEAIRMGIEEEKILPITALKIPGFRLMQYMRLKNSSVSIIANNCWGGITYHYLKMKFQSPFINMFMYDDDYIKMLKNFEYKMSRPIKLGGTEYNELLNINYPVYDLDGCKLYMNHYSDFQEAEKKWNERCKRINWDNLFFMMFTSSREIAEEFDKLSFSNKVCFVPFKTDLKSALYLPMASEQEPFWSVVNKCASGIYKGYDIVELLTGKIGLSKRVEVNLR